MKGEILETAAFHTINVCISESEFYTFDTAYAEFECLCSFYAGVKIKSEGIIYFYLQNCIFNIWYHK